MSHNGSNNEAGDASSPSLIFTITAGRTGTKWLSELIGRNLGIESVHEHVGVDDIGTLTPDIRTLRNFNTYGFNSVVRRFWGARLARLPKGPYVETSHVLAKAGLLEALEWHGMKATIICLRRDDIIAHALSFAVRSDFLSITLMWQWYLDTFYPRIIMSPDLQCGHPMLDRIGWYIAEMLARQEYYRRLYPRFNYIDASLEETAGNPEGFLKRLGYDGPVDVPPALNGNSLKPSSMAIDMVKEAFGTWTSETIRKVASEKIPTSRLWEQPEEEGSNQAAA